MTTTLATKGQIVIPKEIRERLLLEAGDDFEIWLDDSNEIILRRITKRPNEGLLELLLSAPGELEIPTRSLDAARPVDFS